jgi:hypothetical protein
MFNRNFWDSLDNGKEWVWGRDLKHGSRSVLSSCVALIRPIFLGSFNTELRGLVSMVLKIPAILCLSDGTSKMEEHNGRGL